MRKRFSMLFAGMLALSCQQAFGVINSLTTEGDGVTLSTVTVDGLNYSLGDLIGVDITAFNGGTTVLLVESGGSAPASGSRAKLLDGDAKLNTGVINPDVGSMTASLDFDSAVRNTVGTDLFLLEYDPASDNGNDGLQVTINGTTVTYGSSEGTSLVSNVATSVLQSTGTGNVDSLNELENDPFVLNSNTTQDIFGYSVNLDDFGVAAGDTITSMSFGSSGSTIDPVFVAGLPEPPGAPVMTTRFQEGVSPTGAYTHDAVYIRESQPNTNMNGDADQEIIVGFTNDNNELRGLLEFDISAIPVSDLIDSASLVLRTESPVGGLGGTITIDVYEYDFDMDEAVSTWNDPDGDGNDATGDTTPGGTLGSLLTSATFNANTQNLDITFIDSAAFRMAVSDALADDGIIRLMLTRSDDSGSGQHRFARFDDETVASAGFRPELLISHRSFAIPEPTSAMLAMFGVLGLGVSWRRRASMTD